MSVPGSTCRYGSRQWTAGQLFFPEFQFKAGAPLCSLPCKQVESGLQFVIKTEPRGGFLTGNASAPLISSGQNCCTLCSAEIKQKAIDNEKMTGK